ncbi:iron-siderophore ABC transporter substrate-binding protein [Corynebacterium sp. sy039]|uniref:iron-siderophore ABC transporter substrate-binding protein n=1 Tax=Corynebacterium sp. sy039 TaxID=2599641 RepID=UPI0011B759D9|nr:iron-siderophore ABC transporter substrate-binding protein [Corynebacterium sp. sy039]QDZ43298.1 iron-siderophore ABC transporter substrate-binding protein [Corynebacterium sp. sy039]
MKIKKALTSTAVVLALCVTVVGCSTDKEETNSSNAQSNLSEQGAFPVTIEHRYGSTEIKEAPQRVVSLGYTDQDALLALGVTPVSVKYWDGMTPDGQAAGNWSKDKLKGEQPRIDKDTEINVEAIAKDNPDLIVAVYSDLDKDTYKKLSEIAPVVVQKGEYEELQQPWDVSTEEIGYAVGKPEEAKRLVQRVKEKFTELRQRHPEWAEKELGVATIDDDNLAVFSEGDPRSRFFTDLGFKINPAYAAITKGKFYGEVSRENVDQVNSDVLIWDQLSYSPKQSKESVTKDPIVSKLPAVEQGHSVYLEGDLEKAFGWQTVLSLDYLLDKIEQPLTNAAK